MRLRLSLNAAGDMRLQCLRDKKAPPKPRVLSGTELVCSAQLQEMTTPRTKTPRPGFGALGSRQRFTRVARTLIREVGAILDDGCRQELVFLTGTLPGSTHDALVALAAWSGWVVQTVQQWIRDTTPGSSFFGVWEWQRRGALHLHVVVRTSSRQAAGMLKQLWKARWIRVLDSVGQRSRVDMYGRQDGGTWVSSKWVVRTDAQTVEKSVASYLSKYLSKGSVKGMNTAAVAPVTWWFCQRTLRTQRLERRREVLLEELSPPCAVDLYQRVSALVVEPVLSAFAYSSPYDAMVKGIVALYKPIHASLMFDHLAGILRVLGGGTRGRDAPLNNSISAIYAMLQCLRIVQPDESYGYICA